MTCIHIERAKNKLNSLIERLNNENSRIYEEWTYVDPDNIKARLESSGVIFKDYTAKTTWTNSDKKIINKDALKECLNDLKRDLNDCNCFSNANSRVDTLNKVHEEMVSEILNQSRRVENSYKEMIGNQSSIIKEKERENSIVVRENSNLQHSLGLSKAQAEQLEIRLTEKSNELNQQSQVLERLRQAFQDLLVNSATYQTEARVVREQLDWTKGRVEFNDSRVLKLEKELDEKRKELRILDASLNNLKEVVRDRDSKISDQSNRIKLLKEKADEAQENLFGIKENYKEEGLEEIASQLGISLEYVNRLRNHYERLVDARKNFNRDNIETHERCIVTVKQEMVEQGIHIKYIQKICRKCEKLAEIRFELEKTRQEQYQAQQEIPVNNF